MTAKITFVVLIIGAFFSNVPLIESSTLAFGSTFIGFAEKDITPKEPQALAGYGTSFLSESSLRLSEGVHDPLKVGAVALKSGSRKTLVLVSVDAVGVSPRMVERIKKAAAFCVNADIFVSATHTHHAPDVVGLWGALPKTGRDESYMNFFESQIVSAICDASLRMVEGRLFIGASALTPTSVSRENDSNLTFLRFENLKGEMLGSLTQWNAHPTSMTAKNRMISADFPGAFRKLMYSKHPKAVNLYFSGTLGGTYSSQGLDTDQDLFPDSPRSQKEAIENYRLMSSQAKRIFDKIAEIKLRPLAAHEIKSMELNLDVSNQNFIFGWAFALHVLESRPEAIKDGNTDQIMTKVGLLSLGDLAIATLPGEVFPGVSNEIRNLLFAQGFKSTMIFGITNDWLGYIIYPKSYRDDEMKYYRSLSIGSEIGQKAIEGFKLLTQGIKVETSRIQ